jgi:hypothetical protein
MTNYESPSFEDLEPEGADIEMSGDLGSEEEFEVEDVHGFPSEALGEYEFRDPEEFEDLRLEPDEPSGYQRRMVAPSSLARLAARTALKWGSQACATSIVRGHNGRGPVPHTLRRVPTIAVNEDYLAEPEAELPDSASAALLEDYELMEALAAVAATTDRGAEAERLMAASIPVSLRLAPTVYRALWPGIPALMNGTVGVTRLLYRRSDTRPAIRLVPTILHTTIAELAQYAADHKPITIQLAAKVLARQTATVLGHRHGRGPATHRARRSKRRPQQRYDSYYSQEWWDDGYGT